MSGPEAWDEFELIDRLFRPLAEGAPEALELRDDAAVIESRPGFDLVVTTDVIVEGVHFLHTDPADSVARKLLRVNLSDLAAKGARPYGYFLNICWPARHSPVLHELFAAGLSKDQQTFGLKLFGGDTTSTPGPLTLGATMLGWVPSGTMVRRSGAKAGDLVLVSGVVGDAMLGLRAAQAGLPGFATWENELLTHRYRVPSPRLDLAPVLARVRACADVSDGLIADAGRIAEASGLGLEFDLERIPLSPLAMKWAGAQDDLASAMLALASGGDDYELVCAAPSEVAPMHAVGRFVSQPGTTVRFRGRTLPAAKAGFRHGRDD